MGSEGLAEYDNIRVAFAVPICATSQAIRFMSAKLQAAMMLERFGSDGTSACDLVSVSKAEAQATHACVLAHFGLKLQEPFLSLEIGSGTTDLGIYETHSEKPLRLKPGVIKAKAALLNPMFQKLMECKLMPYKQYLCLGNNMTLPQYIERCIMKEFENIIKRAFEFDKDSDSRYWIDIPGLWEVNDGTVLNGQFGITQGDLWTEVLKDTVIGIGAAIKNMLCEAAEDGLTFETILVGGGFRDSPCLQQYLKVCVESIASDARIVTYDSLRLHFMHKGSSAISVSGGACMRAQDQTNGPPREPQQSLGIVRDGPVQKGVTYTDYERNVVLTQRQRVPIAG
ncbi:hypothetical protein E8E11_010121 [Didymella keratinophila]|nr:hypothetical protein E8E11_010121 [Didymella keratinophila]